MVRPRIATLTGTLLAASLLAGCTGEEFEDTSSYISERVLSDVDLFGDPREFTEQIELSDGRKVSMFYASGRGLVEQHYSPEADAWTEPQLIYATDTDPCQVITLEESGGTVAVSVDWGVFCFDGEPPFESIAAVATGDLTEWETDLTEGFDGWAAIEIAEDGESAEWARAGARLTWEVGDGFSGGVEE